MVLSVCLFIMDDPFSLLFTQGERETAEENKYCHSLPAGDPILKHHWQESAVIAYLTLFSVHLCVCFCDSNSPLSLEQMPLTDVIQLPTVTVNKTMNCSSPTHSVHPLGLHN